MADAPAQEFPELPVATQTFTTAVDAKTGKLFVRHPQLGLTLMSPDDVARTPGLEPVSESDAESIRSDARLRESIGTADAVALGLARGVSARLYDPIHGEGAQARHVRREFAATEEEYPFTTGGAELAGAVAGAFIPGSPVGMATRAGIGTSEALAARGFGRLVAGTAGLTVEGAGFIPGSVATEAWMRDVPVTTDMVSRHAGGILAMSALLGGFSALPGAFRDRAAKTIRRELGTEAAEAAGYTQGDELIAAAEPRFRDKFQNVAGGGLTPEMSARARQNPSIADWTILEKQDAFKATRAVELSDAFDASNAASRFMGHHTSGKLKKGSFLKNVDESYDTVSAAATRRTLDDLETELANGITAADRVAREAIDTSPNLSGAQRQATHWQRDLDHAEMAVEQQRYLVDNYSRAHESVTRNLEVLRKGSKAEAVRTAAARVTKKEQEIVRLARNESRYQPGEFKARMEMAKAELARLQKRATEIPDEIEAAIARDLGEQKRLTLAMSTARAKQDELAAKVAELKKNLDAGGHAREIDPRFAPPALAGEKSARTILRNIRAARAEIAKAKTPKERIAARMTELDYLNRTMSSAAKGGQHLGVNDSWAAFFRNQYEFKLRPVLIDEKIWGSKAAGFQRELNAVLHDQLNISEPIRRRLLRDSGTNAEYSTWFQDKIADHQKFREMMEKSSDELTKQDRAEFVRYVKNDRHLADVALRYMDIPADKVPVLQKARDEADRLLGLWGKTEKHMAELTKLRRGLGQASGGALREARIIGAATAGGPGLVAGQGVMMMASPLARLQMLGRLREVRRQGDSAMLRWVDKLLGGKGAPVSAAGDAAVAAVPAKAAAVEKPRGSRGVLFDAMALMTTERGETESERYDRLLERLQASTSRDTAGRAVDEVLGPLGAEVPEMREHMVTKVVETSKALLETAPRPMPSAGSVWGAQFRPEMNPVVMQRWSETFAAALDPGIAMDKAVKGEITPEVVAILDRAHPDLMAYFRNEVMMRVQSDKPPPFEKRVALGILLQIPTDPTLSADFQEAMTFAHSARKAKMQPQESGGRTFNETGLHLGDDRQSASESLERGFTER